jgi:hypothetical protein
LRDPVAEAEGTGARHVIRLFGAPVAHEEAEAVLEGRWIEAADIYDEMGARPYAALASLRAAEALVAEGGQAPADVQLARALACRRAVGAPR